MLEIGYPLRARILGSPVGRRLIGPLVTRRGAGLLTVLVSALSIGAVTPFSRLAFDGGVKIGALMTARYGIAALVIGSYLVRTSQSWRLKGGEYRQAIGLALALGVLSLAFFASVSRIPASLAALIYYTHPILVSFMVYRIWHSQKRLEIDFVTLGGQILSVAGLVLILGFSWNSLDLTGVVLAALSALMIALIYVFGDQLMQSVPSMVLGLHVALINTAMFSVMAILHRSSLVPHNSQGWVGMAGVAAFFTVGFMGMFLGLRLLGPSQAACVKNAEPIAAVAFSFALLGESFGAWQFVGAGVVIAGMLVGCRTFANFRWHDLLHLTSEGAELATLENCTPLCRVGSRCLLA
ncbi:MAG: DMT family transporter [Anaerolineales bacterium]